jgi:hypothetical protein
MWLVFVLVILNMMLVLSLFFNNNTMSGATSRLGTDYPSGAHEVTISFFVVRVAQSLFFYIVFSGSLFVAKIPKGSQKP